VTPPLRLPAGRVLAAGAALIALAWVLMPAPSPPLYDGLSGPAEAYRYLNPPAGSQSTPPPSSANTTLAVSGGSNAAGFLSTSEQPPQAQFLVGQGSLQVPAGSTSVTITVKPVAPPAPIPATDGRLDGNVYEVSISADKPGPVTVRPGATQPTVVLRGPPGSSGAVIERSTAAAPSWRALHTVPIGGQTPDIVAANTDQLGWFAMVLGTSSASSTSSGPGGSGGGGGGGFPIVAVVAPLAALLLLGAVIVPIRLSRARAAQGAGRGGRGGRGSSSRRR